MITENLSILNIHKLNSQQYKAAKEQERLEEGAFYLVEEDDIIATGEIQDGKGNRLSNKIDSADILEGGKIKSDILPSYVDDVIEVNTYAELPLTGEQGKIYVVLTGNEANQTYRWTGGGYINISNPIDIASNETAGIVKIGYTENGQNYPVELDSNSKMFVTIPWTDTNTTTSVNGKTGEVKDEILALINQQLGVIENGSY